MHCTACFFVLPISGWISSMGINQIGSTLIARRILASKEPAKLNFDPNIGEVGFITCKYSQIWKNIQKLIESHEHDRFPLQPGVVNAMAPGSKVSSQKESWSQQVLVLFPDLQNHLSKVWLHTSLRISLWSLHNAGSDLDIFQENATKAHQQKWTDLLSSFSSPT